MDPIIQLWLPILVSSVVVFIISSVLHMMFKYHNSDFKKFNNKKRRKGILRYKL